MSSVISPNPALQSPNAPRNPYLSSSNTRKQSLFRGSMQSLLQKGKAFLTPSGSSSSLHPSGFRTEKTATGLFPATDPAIDGDECLHDCSTCTVDLPRKWEIDETDKLYGQVKGWETHLVIGTGKTDWKRDVVDEKGSLMQEVGRLGLELKNGKLMLSASDLPTGHHCQQDEEYGDDGQTRCIVLPRWEMVEGITTKHASWLLDEMIGKGVSNSTPLNKPTNTPREKQANGETVVQKSPEPTDEEEPDVGSLTLTESRKHNTHDSQNGSISMHHNLVPPGVIVKPCPHRAIILMCSHGTRDWRCGKSAPLLRKEFERHLRPLGLYRDIHDERPGGVGIYFINHVGGHKYSANVMVYRREGKRKEAASEGTSGSSLSSEAVQGIWLARVRPEDCENIVKYTVLEGKLVKPLRQLRGGFDREKGLLSW